MQENKRIMIFSVISSIISIIIIKLNFHHENEVSEFLYSFFQNVFAGLIVLIGTSWISYCRKKKEVLEGILSYCERFKRMFFLIGYLQIEGYKNYYEFEKELKENNKNYDEYSEKTKKEKYRKYDSEILRRNKSEIEKKMKQYIKMSEYDLTDFWNLYGEIDFIYDKKSKQDIYKNLFNYIENVFDSIIMYSYHFKIYFEEEHGNIFVNRMNVELLQKEIFVKVDKSEYEKYKRYSYIVLNNGEMVVNRVFIHLEEQYEKIWEKTYGKKRKDNL